MACVDTLEGDSEGHIRFKTPEEAQAVVNDRSAVAKEHGWALDLLSPVRTGSLEIQRSIGSFKDSSLACLCFGVNVFCNSFR